MIDKPSSKLLLRGTCIVCFALVVEGFMAIVGVVIVWSFCWVAEVHQRVCKGWTAQVASLRVNHFLSDWAPVLSLLAFELMVVVVLLMFRVATKLLTGTDWRGMHGAFPVTCWAHRFRLASCDVWESGCGILKCACPTLSFGRGKQAIKRTRYSSLGWNRSCCSRLGFIQLSLFAFCAFHYFQLYMSFILF